MAIVPAAGASRRMGRDKLLLPWRRTVVLGAVLRNVAAAVHGAVPIGSATGGADGATLDELRYSGRLRTRIGPKTPKHAHRASS